MSSSFKNFFITFAICLLVFALLGVWLYNILTDSLDGFADGNGSESVESSIAPDESDEVSREESIDTTYDENGDIFTAVVMCVDSDNTVVNCAFIDANGKTKQYIYCVIPPSTKITNSVGNAVPIADMFGTMSPDEIAKCVSAMTGIETDYCFRFQRDDMSSIASMISGASVKLTSPIKIPLFDEDDLPSGDTSTDDSSAEGTDESIDESELYVTIENDDDGKVLLNKSTNGKSNLQWLLEYEKEHTPEGTNTLYAMISRELFRQFFTNQGATKKVSVLNNLMSIADDNFNSNAASQHLETIFSNNKFDYHSYTFPANWGTAIEDLRRFDGRYNYQ